MKKILAFMLAMMLCFSMLVSCNLPGGEQESEESEESVCGGKDDSFNFIDCEHNWERIDNLNESIARDECTKCGMIKLYTDPDKIGETEKIGLSMATLISLVEMHGADLSFEHFLPYRCEDIGSGRIILQYPIDDDYYLIINGIPMVGELESIRLVSADDPSKSIDVRYESIEDFISGYSDETEETKEQIVLEVEAEDMMAGFVPNTVTVKGDLDSYNAAVTDFAIRLFNAANEDGKSTLISPMSVLYALSMTANGAEGETRAQIEETLGMSVEELNIYLYSYMQTLPQGEKYKLNIANSIWFTDDQRFTVNQSFLQKNADYYGADIYKSAFDEQTLKDINNWVNYQTDGLIPNALDEISEDAIMYLINAILFDAEWESMYNKYSVYDGKFTTEDGRKIDYEFMRSDEYLYIEDENATGFIKNYSGRKYAFAALLPNEGISVSEYLAGLDGEKLSAILSGAEYDTVYATMPKFETEYDVEMSKILCEMGIADAFSSSRADFSGLGVSGAGNIYISRVIHKTFIEVSEKGTKAGAVTIIEMEDESAPDEPKFVTLDRPFVYMLIDCENNIPFFIGTMMGN